MAWLDHNLIADMYGPAFLAFYAVVIGLTAIICRWWVRTGIASSSGRPVLIPPNIDPYDVAYLRGGENEVLRLMIFDLMERGYLEVQEMGNPSRRRPVNYIAATAGRDRSYLDLAEQTFVAWFDKPRSPSAIFQSGHLLIFERCAAIEKKLIAEELLNSNSGILKARRVGGTGIKIVCLLGAYKSLVALSHGHNNIAFLIVMMICGAILLVRVTRLPRVTTRGQEYLSRLRAAFGSHKRITVPLEPGMASPMLLTVGIMGIGSLAGTPYDQYRETFARSASASTYGSSGGCASSAGGGSSCGSSSCGSSGGGSSGGGDSGGGEGGDGGGGGGGGGCGGCGGGG